MELTIWQQMQQALDPHTNVLIALPPQPSTDAIASAAALLAVCDKLGKKAVAVSDGFTLPADHQFLPRANEIQPLLTKAQTLTLNVNIAGATVDALTYDASDTTLSIHLATTGRELAEQDVRTHANEGSSTFIITLGAPELHTLGPLFENHAAFFYHTPLLNIDHRPTNTQYGQVNCVQLTATSVAEILYEFLAAEYATILDEPIATNLLAGMITKSKSFQSPTVTPRSLEIASELVQRGAKREDVIRNFYQTKTLSTLQLWGVVLRNLRTAHHDRLAWSTVPTEQHEGRSDMEEVLASVLDELIGQSAKAEIIAVLYHLPGQESPHALIATRGGHNGRELFSGFQPEQHREFLRCTIPAGTLQQAEQKFVDLAGAYLQSASQA